MKVRNQLVDEIKASGTGKNADHGCYKSEFSTVFKRWNYKTEHRRGKHNSRREGEHDIGKSVRRLFEQKANKRADKRCTADTERRKQYGNHIYSLFKLSEKSLPVKNYDFKD